MGKSTKNKKPNWKQKVIMVYCRNCERLFCDSINWERAKNPEFEVGFVCPYCREEIFLM